MRQDSWKKRRSVFAPTSDVRIVVCSGGSNVGQIANQAAIGLAKMEVEIDKYRKNWDNCIRDRNCIVCVDSVERCGVNDLRFGFGI